jgi:hypothetical protein
LLLGDINGDGFDDILLGVPTYMGGSGLVYVLFGQNASIYSYPVLDTHYLSPSAPVFRILGLYLPDVNSTLFGFSVSSAGDFNNDGFGDIIVGAPAFDNGRGLSYVIFGHPGPFQDIDLNHWRTNNRTGFRIIGGYEGDSSGATVSVAGDINGDGFVDLIVGSPTGYAYDGSSGGLAQAGVSYIVYGFDSHVVPCRDLLLTNSSTFGMSGFAIFGEASNDQSGSTVGSAGDVNGDGLADVLIAAPHAQSDTGKVYVVYGRPNHISSDNSSEIPSAIPSAIPSEIPSLTPSDMHLRDIASDQSLGFVITGANMYAAVGCSLGRTGDFNGDSINDLLIGACGLNYYGGAYVIFGKSHDFAHNIALQNFTASNSSGFVIEDYHFGGCGASMDYTDLNGDGYSDVIVGSPMGSYSNLDWNTMYAGVAHVIFGKPDDISNINLMTMNNSEGFKIYGYRPSEGCGASVVGVGDINGDLFEDLVVSCPDASVDGQVNAGIVYVLFGNDSKAWTDFNLANFTSGIDGWKILGAAAGDHLGSIVQRGGM